MEDVIQVLSKSAIQYVIEESTTDYVKLRCSIRCKEEAEEFLVNYSSETSTNWIVYYERPSPQRFIMNKSWLCQHSSRNKKRNSTTQRNANCEARIKIYIKINSKGTRKTDKYLKMSPPLTALVKISLKHSHAIGAPDILRHRRVSEKVKEAFYDYFNLGMSVCESRHFHESKLLAEDDGHKLLTDASYNPTARQVRHLYTSWRKEHTGPTVVPLNKVKERIEFYRNEGSDVHIREDCILIVTPIAKRNQALPSSSEMIFVDSTSICETIQFTLTVMLSATAAGPVPICILIHHGQDLHSYKNAFGLLKLHFPDCFGGKSEPQAFITDDSSNKKVALCKLWPSARQLLCQFHVALTEWRWLCSSDSGISTFDRHRYMKLFQKVMYAKEDGELEIALSNILNQQENTQFLDRFKTFYELRKDEWVFLFRKNLITNNNTVNYAEITIRILKDIALSRTTSFNIVALVDFCVISLEKYFQNRILDHACNKNPKDAVSFRNMCSRMEEVSAEEIYQQSEYTYSIPSGNGNEECTVDILVGLCDCPFGSQGAFCMHMALLVQKLKVPLPNSPTVTITERYMLGQLALGDKCPRISKMYGYKSVTSDSVIDNLQNTSESNTTVMDLAEVHVEEEPKEDDLDNETQELIEKIDVEWVRIKSIIEDTNKVSLRKALFCLNKIKNSSQLDKMCLNMASTFT